MLPIREETVPQGISRENPWMDVDPKRESRSFGRRLEINLPPAAGPRRATRVAYTGEMDASPGHYLIVAVAEDVLAGTVSSRTIEFRARASFASLGEIGLGRTPVPSSSRSRTPPLPLPRCRRNCSPRIWARSLPIDGRLFSTPSVFPKPTRQSRRLDPRSGRPKTVGHSAGVWPVAPAQPFPCLPDRFRRSADRVVAPWCSTPFPPTGSRRAAADSKSV